MTLYMTKLLSTSVLPREVFNAICKGWIVACLTLGNADICYVTVKY